MDDEQCDLNEYQSKILKESVITPSYASETVYNSMFRIGGRNYKNHNKVYFFSLKHDNLEKFLNEKLDELPKPNPSDIPILCDYETLLYLEHKFFFIIKNKIHDNILCIHILKCTLSSYGSDICLKCNKKLIPEVNNYKCENCNFITYCSENCLKKDVNHDHF